MVSYFEKKIPERKMPGESKEINSWIDETMVDLSDYFDGSVYIENIYYSKGIKGATNRCIVRTSVAKKLEEAIELLPQNITFKVYDAWRPLQVQEELYKSYYEALQNEHREWSDLKIEKEIVKFVSEPDYDTQFPAVHSTGGAIDLTLAYKDNGIILDMGTEFDAFTPLSHTDSFERQNNENVKRNRRLLYWVMTEAGFTNLPSEWWHYDYGDRFWAYYKNSPALYGSVKKILSN